MDGIASKGQAPSVREAMHKISAFSKLICAQEALARNGAGGIVRIEAMAPVIEAIDRYVSQLPAAEVEG